MISTLLRQKLEDHKFKASLGYKRAQLKEREKREGE